jgi:hypothetical protein
MLIGVWQRAERKKKVQAGNSKIPRKMEIQITETRRAETCRVEECVNDE